MVWRSGVKYWDIPFYLRSPTPFERHSLTQGLSENVFKEADRILNPSHPNFKDFDGKKLGCQNLLFHREGGGGGGGGVGRKWNVSFSKLRSRKS